jgi:hypothetical protein
MPLEISRCSRGKGASDDEDSVLLRIGAGEWGEWTGSEEVE